MAKKRSRASKQEHPSSAESTVKRESGDSSSGTQNDTSSESDSSQKNESTASKTKSEPWVSEETITNFFDRLSDATSSAFRFAKKTTDTSYKVGKALISSQDQLKVMVAAGQSLKDLREVAGLTISELSEAINLKDKSILEAVEEGTSTLSFELILRLSALLARNDPIPFILKFSRTYSPETWKLLNDWGAGRLPLQYQREREFINIYRSQDQARKLTDEGFNKVLEFTREAFNLALHFISEQEATISAVREEVREELKALKAQANSPQELGEKGRSATDKDK